MIQENEIILLLLGTGVLIFLLGNRQKLKHIPVWKILIAGFCVILAGWVLTVLEGFFWKELFNLLEHACYAGGSILMAVWCFKVFVNRKDAK